MRRKESEIESERVRVRERRLRREKCRLQIALIECLDVSD